MKYNKLTTIYQYYMGNVSLLKGALHEKPAVEKKLWVDVDTSWALHRDSSFVHF